jgi:hypothetical protein
MVFGASGNVLLRTFFTGNKLKMNISSLSPGYYILKIKQSNGELSPAQKFVKL